MWQCLSGCFASCQRLFYRHISRDKDCPRCGAEEKTINHLIFECPPARQVWALSSILSAPYVFPSRSLYCNLDYLYERGKDYGASEDSLRVFPLIMWYISKAKNHKFFDNFIENPHDTLGTAIQEEEAWRKANSKDNSTNEESRELVVDILPRDIPICYTNGSWHGSDARSGHGW